MYRRTILKQIRNSLNHFPVTILSGPRQVGKSTELYNHIRPLGYTYVTLDNRAELMTAKNDPELFLRNHPAPLIILREKRRYRLRLVSFSRFGGR